MIKWDNQMNKSSWDISYEFYLPVCTTTLPYNSSTRCGLTASSPCSFSVEKISSTLSFINEDTTKIELRYMYCKKQELELQRLTSWIYMTKNLQGAKMILFHDIHNFLSCLPKKTNRQNRFPSRRWIDSYSWTDPQKHSSCSSRVNIDSTKKHSRRWWF